MNTQQLQLTTAINLNNKENFNVDDINEDNPSWKEVVKLLKEMHKALSFLSDSHHDFKIALKNLEDENKILKAENIKKNKRLSNLESEFFN